MKALLASLILAAASASASAAMAAPATSSVDACPKHLPCGTFEGAGANFDENGKSVPGGEFLEKLIVTPVNATTVTVENFVYDKTHQPEDDYVLRVNLEFQEDGQFTATKSGRLFASGVCKNFVCTFNFVPWKNTKGSMTGNVNIFRFQDGRLKRQMMSSIDFDDVAFQRSELSKK